MGHASATAVFEYSVYPDDLKQINAKLGCQAQGVEAREWPRSGPPAEVLIYLGGAGSHFGTSAQWACKAAKDSGHPFAGLSFNGELPIAPVDASADPGKWADALWSQYEALSAATYAAYQKTDAYAESQKQQKESARKAASDEAENFEAAIAILDQGGVGLDLNPALYQALGAWVEARDHVSADPGGAHRKMLLGRLLKAGFVDSEGVGNPAVKDKSDPRAFGRYCVGQVLNMGLSTSGFGGGAIHPMIGEWMRGHAASPGLKSLWLAVSEQSTLEQGTPLAEPTDKKLRV